MATRPDLARGGWVLLRRRPNAVVRSLCFLSIGADPQRGLRSRQDFFLLTAAYGCGLFLSADVRAVSVMAADMLAVGRC